MKKYCLTAACLAGSYPAAPGEVAAVIGRAAGLPLPAPVDAALPAVVLDLRLLRALLAYGVGAALAVAGAVFQGVLRNPLADPFTLGVSGGAAFGVLDPLWRDVAACAAFGSGWGVGAGAPDLCRSARVRAPH